MLELYHWEPNGAFLKPLIALHEKGLAFGSRYVDVLSFERYRPGFLEASRETQLNPEGEGPVLVHDGKQITESLFILEYLEDAFPATPLRPADALSHARILAWARFINEVFMPAVSTLGCHTYLAPQFKGRDIKAFESSIARIPMQHVQEGWRAALTDDYSPELLEDSHRKVSLSVRRIEDALVSADWLVGSSYSLADIDAFSICHSLTELTPGIVNDVAMPRLMSWLTRIRSRPAVRAALALSRTGKPEQAFVPGPEHSRWG
jgi:GSH-dependent disulfide-bond oxidoreductase